MVGTHPTLLRRVQRVANRRSGLVWRYGSNLGPVLRHRFAPRSSGPAQRDVLRDLTHDGFAMCAFDHLLPGDVFHALVNEAQRAEAAEHDRIDAVRRGGSGPWPHKPYVVPLLGERPSWDLESRSLSTAMHDGLAAVADGWFAMRTTVRECNYWWTAAHAEVPHSSQLWHRDVPVDRVLLKCFIYLSDVGPESGPIGYVAGSHRRGRLRLEPSATSDDRAMRVSDDAMRRAAPNGTVRTLVGKAGTVVFLDTSGWHRGGHATGDERLVWMCQYSSLGAWRPGFFTRRGLISEPADRGGVITLGSDLARR